ncbi:MAG: LapA family protein [Bauldia sp.]|nr:LapA family protein [Bauldia sp.]
MKRLARYLVFLPVAVVVVILSVANRAPVSFSLDPFNPEEPAFSVQLPLYWLIFAVLAVGIVTGGLATWLGQTHWRRDARVRAAELARLRQEPGAMRADPTRPRLPATR